jgi:hypothetical protein
MITTFSGAFIPNPIANDVSNVANKTRVLFVANDKIRAVNGLNPAIIISAIINNIGMAKPEKLSIKRKSSIIASVMREKIVEKLAVKGIKRVGT